MNISLDNCVKDNGKCETCKNSGICKYSEEFDRVISHVSTIEIVLLSPIKVTATCSRYEKRPDKQDGFYHR